jgi:hypothetical protein
MASAPSRKYELGLPQEDMEDMLMSSEMAFDDAEYNAKCEEEGPAFPAKVVRQRKTFRESFDKLVGKGCRPEVLFRCLHYLLRSELREASCQFPGKREIRSLEASLRKGVEEIRAFEEKYAEAHSLRVLSHCVSLQGAGPYEYEHYFNRTSFLSEKESSCVTNSMLTYAEMLRSWWTPRSDVIKSYGSIANCVYAKLVTGKPQLSIVAELNSSFLGRHIEPATLRKNLSRFLQRNRKFFIKMLNHIGDHHDHDGWRSSRASEDRVDWPKVFGSKADKSK